MRSGSGRAAVGGLLRNGFIALTLLSSQAVALSCQRPDVLFNYTQAEASERDYVVVRGRFSESARLTRPQAGQQDETLGAIPFTGQALTETNFGAPFAHPVQVRLSCIGPWCSGPPPETPVIAFFVRTSDGYQLDYGPCSGWLTKDLPSERTRLLACHRAGNCESPL